MWKTFKYDGKQRVAYLPPEGPAYQVSPVPGFRGFKPEKMEDVASADNCFGLIKAEDLENYPELELAKKGS